MSAADTSFGRAHEASDVHARLAVMIAAAAPFSERVRSEYLVPLVGENIRDVEPRVRRWLRTVAAGDGEALRAVMEHLAATGQPLGAGLRTVCLRDSSHLPSWASSFLAFFAAQPSDEPSTSLLTGFERASHVLLPRNEGCIEGIEVTDSAYAGIVGALVGRLIEVCDPAMRFELQLSMPELDPAEWLGTRHIDASQAGWLERMERFPALVFLIGIACEQWRKYVVEILGRLRTDIPLLRREPFRLDERDPLAEFKGGAGDRHADGTSVALLRFASGRGIVYKPKDLRHVEAMMKLISFLNGAGLPLSLGMRSVVCREGYGWEERVDPTPVADRSGFQRFYQRLGMLMRLAQVLNGRDLWADNLVAVGEQPFLADLECLFSPPIHPPPQLATRRQALVERMEKTVVRTAMPLQAWLPSPDCPTRDLGCLSHAGDRLEAGGGALPIAAYRPFTSAETADPWNHGNDVITGYMQMHHVLLSNRDELLRDDGPLKAFSGVRMRYIWRGTSDCHAIVRASVSPAALLDGVARDTLLAALLRGAFTQMGRAWKIPEITDAEIDAFRRLDVPLFTSLTTSSSLFTADGTEIKSHFADTAWNEVRRRIATLDEPIEADVAILRAAIDAARGGTELKITSGKRNRFHEDEVTLAEVVGAVQDIAELLVNARRPPLSTGGGWLGLLWSPASDVWEVGPAAADLIGGALGPALFLAEHFSLTGDSQSWTASHETLDELLELASYEESASLRSRPLGAIVPGGFAGPGALVYVLARLTTSLDDRSLLVAGRKLVQRVAAMVQEPSTNVDLAFGLAGLLLDLLRLRTDHGGDSNLDLLVSDLAARLSKVISDSDGAPGSTTLGDRLGDLVPMERDGVALALSRALAVAPELMENTSTVGTLLAAHSFDIGRRGSRLAAVAVHGCAPAVTPRNSVDRAQLSTRELLFRAEEAQLTARHTGKRAAASEARRCMRVLLDRRAESGQWFPDRMVDDRLNLSALDGLPALGSVLLRHLRPELPMVSLLE